MNVNIKIEKETRKVFSDKYVIGNDAENLQGNLIFNFDEFVDGQARLEFEANGIKDVIYLEKNGKTYQTPILSKLTKEGQIDMQLVITEGTDINEIPVFKSNVFSIICHRSLNVEEEQPEEYPSWIEIANAKLNQVDKLDIGIKDGIVTITKKDGTTESENVKGEKGEKGDAGSIKIIPITEFPSENIDESAIYIIPNETSSSEDDRYKEYIYVNGGWEPFGGGSLNIDLEDYATLDDVNTAIETAMAEVGGDAPIYNVNLNWNPVKSFWDTALTNEDLLEQMNKVIDDIDNGKAPMLIVQDTHYDRGVVWVMINDTTSKYSNIVFKTIYVQGNATPIQLTLRNSSWNGDTRKNLNDVYIQKGTLPYASSSEIGTLSNLNTTNKSNLVDAINEVKTSISEAIGTALEGSY